MDENERIKPAEVGQKFTCDGHEMTVGPKCDKDKGRWYCITHDEGFTNQFMKDSHISKLSGPKKKHVLTWVCFEHGPEVP